VISKIDDDDINHPTTCAPLFALALLDSGQKVVEPSPEETRVTRGDERERERRGKGRGGPPPRATHPYPGKSHTDIER